MKEMVFLLFVLGALGAGVQVSADDYPDGCVDCHTQSERRDFRVNTLLAKIGHGRGGERTLVIPDGCTRCHATDDEGTAGSLSKLIHTIHYDGQERNRFVKKYGGDCLNCHSIDGSSGKVQTRSGERNWSLHIVSLN